MNMKQKLYQLKNDRMKALEAAETALNAGEQEEHQAQMEAVKGYNAQIQQVEAFLEEQERFAGQGAPGGAPHVEPTGGGEDNYAKAVKSFAAAARDGFPVKKAAGDLMQMGVDADGGYAVPEDIVTKIIELREAKESLLDLVSIFPVTTVRGRRTIKKRSQHQGFMTRAELAQYSKVATPQLDVIHYAIEGRGGFMAVTQEMLMNSDNNIASFTSEWLSDEARVTGNKEIMEIIHAKAAQELAGLDGILDAWIGLGSTFRATSKLITNDDGLAWLSKLKDANDRYLLSPNPAEPKQLQLCAGPHVLTVKTYDNDTIATEDGKIPMILGDLKEGVAYWDRQYFTVKTFDQAVIGDFNAAAQNLLIWRGDLYDDCTSWDNEAFVNGYVSAAQG
jgi:HK97 family phage major capsid protein